VTVVKASISAEAAFWAMMALRPAEGVSFRTSPCVSSKRFSPKSENHSADTPDCGRRADAGDESGSLAVAF